MFVFLAVALAIFLDRLLGEPPIYHPLRGFSRFAMRIEDAWHAQGGMPFQPTPSQPPQEEGLTPQAIRVIDTTEKFKGFLAILFLVLPFIALADILSKNIPIPLNFVFDVFVLYLSIGAHNIRHHAFDLQQALIGDNLELAKKEVGIMVDHETSNMNRQDLISGSIEAVLEHGNDEIMAPIFWFIVLGPSGAVLCRLISLLNTMWGYQSVRYKNFGWAATKINTVLNWIPARLTSFTYILVGDVRNGWRSFNERAKTWHSPNDELVIASGAGALNLELGGDIYCHGDIKKRSKLGAGKSPLLSDIPRANDLVERSTVAWLGLTLLLSLLHR